jgi:hypothetical protein
MLTPRIRRVRRVAARAIEIAKRPLEGRNEPSS